MMWRGLLALVGGLIMATGAKAEWLEARSRHFVLYANSNDAAIRKQSEALERMDWGLRRFMQVEEEPEIASRKLTVFMIEDRDMRRLCRCTNVAGFYHSMANGSIAYSAKGGWDAQDGFARTVLFHEYAHHFLLGNHDIAFPAWYSEGFAEFASTMRIDPDRVVIGYPAQHRAYGLLHGEKLTVQQLFDPGRRETWSHERMDAFYGRGWLLTHYISFDRERFQSFQKYLKALNSGVPGLEAGEQAFGDLKDLNAGVAKYLLQRRVPGLPMRFNGAELPPVAIRPLSAGEAALIDSRMASLRGVGPDEARKLYQKAANSAARYPDDPIVQGWLAEMAYDAEAYPEALAATQRALSRDAKSVQAVLYRGMTRVAQLRKAKSTDKAAWAAARRDIIVANNLDPDNANPLWMFWLSFEAEGAAPTASAFKALYRAQELAPQDQSVRFAAAVERLKAEELDEATRLLRPIAYHPHAAAENAAVEMLAVLDQGGKGTAALAAYEAFVAKWAAADKKKDGDDG